MEQVVDTAGLTVDTPVQRLLLSRMLVAGASRRRTARTSPTAGRLRPRQRFQKAYAAAASGTDEEWTAFEQRFLAGDEVAYQAAVEAWREEQE